MNALPAYRHSRNRTRQSSDTTAPIPNSGEFGYGRWVLLGLLMFVPGTLVAAEPLPGLDVRFAAAETSEVPDFQRHVTPLLGRLGCNGRACHGSFQGRGGLQLSLFGYDFAADHAALMAEHSGRVDADDVEESLIIAKPTDADLHEGGKRYDKHSWQYHVIRNWVAAGAPYDAKQPARLNRLEVVPEEIVFNDEGQQQPLQVIAHWDSGASEDVTAICRFSSNDDSIAEIDEAGLVTAGSVGDTYVVAYYDKAVVPIPVLRPLTDQVGERYPTVQTRTNVDELVVQKLRKLGVTPSGVCSDADFLRRVRLDLTGTLPSPAEVESFLNDTSIDKRAQLVERLFETPEYAAWWATRFSDWTGNSEAQLNNVLPVRGVASKLWFAWLQKRLADNQPYDQLVEGIVAAESRMPGEGYEDYCEAMTEACGRGNEAAFAERDGMPLYWARRNFRSTDERAIGFAYAFMGIRIQCAQCHKHPFDQWSKDDFAQFGRLFQPVIASNNSSPESKAAREKMMAQLELDGLAGGELRRKIGQLAREGKTVPFPELYVRSIKARPQQKNNKNKRRKAPQIYPTGKILGVEETVSLASDPRDRLMEWLRADDNPYFSKALVNRVWANYFGMGLVQPTDDLNLANPPVNVPLMDYLSQGFIRSGFDLQWLHREIVLSDTYQRSWQPNDTNAADKRNFSHYIPHRLPAEVVHDAVLLATAGDASADELRQSFNRLAIGGSMPPQYRGQRNYALSVFGQSIRETNCDCDRSDDSSLLQSVYLRNDTEIHMRLSDKKGWVAEACRAMKVPGPVAQAQDTTERLQRQKKNYQRMLAAKRKQLQQLNGKQLAARETKIKAEMQRLRDRLAELDGDSPALPGDKPAVTEEATESIGEAVQQAYLRTLCRYPEPAELQRSVAFVHESPTVAEGLESVMWSLINTKEFILNH
ncbi:DUF1549 and DUF1553 domain-containing protein [Roseimaritima ulvae]|uniref:BIG2 domain-containing protein n=1 Tax=Roseimaritima ulvae TaxID=980254 RepID=A0A5B9QZR9_9BACT|nr:DUF1549 and DUF1553 domain-containing protein [Roseimaritima ulvae]QEG42935.1 hypothetical protein UC8_49770 [Roseimaritima ulvae]